MLVGAGRPGDFCVGARMVGPQFFPRPPISNVTFFRCLDLRAISLLRSLRCFIFSISWMYGDMP